MKKMPINKLTSWGKRFLKPFKAINKKIHIATGKTEMGGAVPSPKAGPNPGASFRQVGKSPGDKSGYKVKHLGDKKK